MSKKVLIVDDADDIRKVLFFILKKEGYEVIEAADGEKALAAISEHKPDMVYLDLHLPAIDGDEVCKQVKADDALKEIPIIFLTASDDDLIQEKLSEAKANGFVKKPFDAELIKIKTKEILGE